MKHDAGHGDRFDDSTLRRNLLAELPEGFLAASPMRVGYLLVAIATLIASLWTTHEWLAGSVPFSHYLLAILVAAFVFPFFLFSLHEIGHGALVRSKAGRMLFGWLAGFWIGFQPDFWAKTHRHHHRHANTEQDTDRLRFYDRDEPGARFLDFSFSNPIGIPSAMFAVQILYAFYMGFYLKRELAYPVRRSRVIAALLAHVAGAVCFIYLIGVNTWLLGYLPVFALGCALQNVYVITNHLTRPLTDGSDALGTAQSVHIAGWSHMDFGRHVEHHIFPAVPHRKLRLVSELLRTRYPDQFVETPLLSAVARLFRLPGYYYSYRQLTDRTGRVRIPIE